MVTKVRSKIIYEDEEIIVVHKPAGLAAQTSKIGEQDVVSEMKNHIASENKEKQDHKKQNRLSQGTPYIALINRLDQPVEGIVLLGKTENAARELSRQIQTHEMVKKYYAVISGKIPMEEKTLIDHMRKNPKTNMSEIVENSKEKDVKRAELTYQVLEYVDNKIEIGMDCVQYTASLADITLKTGRHHQIRLQMAHAGMPLLGDGKYGSRESIELSRKIRQREIALCAYHLSFVHPGTKKKMDMEIKPEGALFHIFPRIRKSEKYKRSYRSNFS